MWTQSPTISHKFINTESFLKCDSPKNHKMAHGAILWFFKESHLRKLWPSYDCYFEFGKSSEVQSKSQMRKLSWMPNVFLNPIQKKFLLKFFLTAFENEAQCPVCLQFQRRCPFRTNSSMPTNLLILCAWDMCSYQVCKFVMSSNMQPFKRATTWATDSRCWGGSCSIKNGWRETTVLSWI